MHVSTPVVVEPDTRVVKQLMELEGHYADMIRRVSQCYSNCNLADMQLFLNTLMGTEEFNNCTSICAVLGQLSRCHIDTFHISYLEQLADSFKNVEVTVLIERYNTEKEAFLKETSIAEFHDAIKCRVDPILPGEKRVIMVKIPKRVAKLRTLMDMEILAEKAFEANKKSFVTLHVVSGSIYVSWFFPKWHTTELKRLAHKNKALFQQEGVEEVIIAEDTVYSCEWKKVRDCSMNVVVLAVCTLACCILFSKLIVQSLLLS